MNKMKEFDYIHTPDKWIDECLNQNVSSVKKNIFSYPFILISLLLIFISSFSLVYALNEDFRMWLKGEIPQIEEINIITLQGKTEFVQEFMYLYKELGDEVQVENVKVLQDGKYVDVQFQHIDIPYKNNIISFDYVIHENHILTFHHKGLIEYSLNVMNQHKMYFEGIDMNIYSYDFQTKKVETITKDGISINPNISPNGTYIVIQKSKKYCMIYNTNTKETHQLKDLSPYAHYQNEYDFIDDQHIITYSKETHTDDKGYLINDTYIINLKTLTTQVLDGMGYYPMISYLEIKPNQEKTIIKNLLTNQERKIDYYIDGTSYVISNRYIFFRDYNEQDIQCIYDFKTDKIKKLRIKYSESMNLLSINDEYIMINMENEYQVVALKKLFMEK